MKRFFALLLAVSALLSGCAYIPGSKLPANADRYFLYTANDRVYCLDSQTGKTDEIKTTLAVAGVSRAIVSDSGKKMVFDAALKDSEDYALFYWDGKSAATKLEVRNAELVRISKKMDFLTYLKHEDERYDLYQYDLESGKQLIAENVVKVSMTEDGNSILYLQSSSNEGQFVLFQKKRNGNPKRISELYDINATADHKVICYTKGESEDVLGGLRSAYMWTPSGGEKALPFKVTDIKVFGKNEIYYSVSGSDTFSNYYYDGKASTLLSADGSAHGHKLSDELYTYDAWTGEVKETYLVSKGKQMSAKGYFCPDRSVLGGLSVDGKTVYTCDGEYMYRTTVGSNGKMSTEYYLDVDYLSPRYIAFQGDHLACREEDVLYLDGQMISADVGRFELSRNGETLVYASGGNIYRYTNGKSKVLCPEGPEFLPTASKKVVLNDNGILYLADEKGMEQIAAGCNDIMVATPWSGNPNGNIIVDEMTTGMWYSMMGTDRIVY